MLCSMNQEKMSVSVPNSLVRFVEAYRDQHGLKTKSAVVEHALEALRDQELERAYAAAAAELDPAWDATDPDGLAEDDWP